MPFDGIMVIAGAPEIPRPLTEQLALGGCRFVRLVGQHGWQA
jgi:protein-L-isoaspartate O-methyltransferase